MNTLRTPDPLPRRPGVSKFAALLGLGFMLAAGCESCLKRQPRTSVERLPYPTCGGVEDAGPGAVLAEGTLRGGPTSPTPDLVERFRIERRACHIVATVRQEWSRQIDDVEVVYDRHFRPIRAWKRMSVPAPRGQSPLIDIRRYELRTMPISMTSRTEGHVKNYVFRRREQPVAVIGPGRGLITAWIRAHHLRPNQIVRGPVLDFRSLSETIDIVALRREDDRNEPTLAGRRVRIYTVFGRESVLADENDTVIGDLAGLRPAQAVSAPMPERLETAEAPDPVNTP